MAYYLPSFPLNVNIWRWSHWLGTTPPTASPDVATVANLVPGRRDFDMVTNLSSFLLLPKDTDIRFSESGTWSSLPPTDPDLVEVPAGSKRYYKVWDAEKSGAGFANEHMVASIQKHSPFGFGGSGPPSPGTNTFLGHDTWLQTGSQTGSATLGSAIGPTLPNDLILVVAGSNPVAGITPSDVFGNTYNLITTIILTAGGQLDVWWARNTGTGTLSTTLTTGGSVLLSAGIGVYRGFASTVNLVSPVGSGGTGSVVTFGSVGVPTSMLDVGVCALDPTVSLLANTAGAPFVIAFASTVANPPLILPYAVIHRLNDGTVYSPTCSLFGSGEWVGQSFAFKN